MENSNYNSLTDKLIQNGILSSQDESKKNIFESYYDVEVDENYSNSPFVLKDEEKDFKKENKKRINEYDLDLIKGRITQNGCKSSKKKSVADFLLIKFFPKIYRAKLIKKALKKMFDLNIDTKSLFNKTIPYGENEIRYSELIKYLNYANELQVELRKDN